MVLFPRPGSYGKPDAPAPGSASEGPPVQPRRRVKRDGACAVPLNAKLAVSSTADMAPASGVSP